MPPGAARHRWFWYLSFLAVVIVSLWVPLYNRLEPRLLGIPFFYWFQFVWIIVGGIVTGIAYLCKA